MLNKGNFSTNQDTISMLYFSEESSRKRKDYCCFISKTIFLLWKQRHSMQQLIYTIPQDWKTILNYPHLVRELEHSFQTMKIMNITHFWKTHKSRNKWKRHKYCCNCTEHELEFIYPFNSTWMFSWHRLLYLLSWIALGFTT